jgi:NAD(P)-dependent dehydrogenase (short-subunit alcohol dehydrogenase family)
MNKPITRVAVITGANRGIGLATARAMQDYGFFTILTARDVKQFSDIIDSMNPQWCHFRELDVASEQSIANFCEQLKQDYSRVDILINNAGVYLDGQSPLSQLPLDIFNQTMQTNIYGPLSLMQKIIPLMLKNQYGRIVNISSGMGSSDSIAEAGAGSYKLSKQALNALTRLIAQEVDPAEIKINSVCPGWVRTRMGGPTAPRSEEQAVSGIMWAALLDEYGPTGGFFRDGKEINW